MPPTSPAPTAPTTNLKVVELTRPDISDRLAGELEYVAQKAREGMFNGLVIVLTRPDGSWLTKSIGIDDKLRIIGILESTKTDLLATTEIGQTSGLEPPEPTG